MICTFLVPDRFFRYKSTYKYKSTSTSTGIYLVIVCTHHHNNYHNHNNHYNYNNNNYQNNHRGNNNNRRSRGRGRGGYHPSNQFRQSFQKSLQKIHSNHSITPFFEVNHSNLNHRILAML